MRVEPRLSRGSGYVVAHCPSFGAGSLISRSGPRASAKIPRRRFGPASAFVESPRVSAPELSC
eukprot:9460645-Alexandrium_andersonii.AAC.1